MLEQLKPIYITILTIFFQTFQMNSLKVLLSFHQVDHQQRCGNDLALKSAKSTERSCFIALTEVLHIYASQEHEASTNKIIYILWC